MRWKRASYRNRADRLIAGHFAQEVDRIEVPSFPIAQSPEQPTGAQALMSAADPFVPRPSGLGNRRKRIANFAFALFFAFSFSVITLNVDTPPLFAGYLADHAEHYRLGVLLPEALRNFQTRLSPGLTGG